VRADPDRLQQVIGLSLPETGSFTADLAYYFAE